MMDLDEAIQHARETSSKGGICKECQTEHQQLAEWLEELRDRRAGGPSSLYGCLESARERILKKFPTAQVKIVEWKDDIRLAVYMDPKKRKRE